MRAELESPGAAPPCQAGWKDWGDYGEADLEGMTRLGLSTAEASEACLSLMEEYVRSHAG